MRDTITIDGSGRLVIPKPLRDRLGLTVGTQLAVREQQGRIVLTPQTRAPRMVERDGRLLVDLGEAVEADHRSVRDERLRGLVEYALKR